jgi:O-antigen ligase
VTSPFLRRHGALAAIVAIGLVAGLAQGHVAFALILAVVIVAAWRLGGFGPVAAVCIATIALGSASYHELRQAGLDERWVGLGTLAAWPLVSRRRPELPASRLFCSAIAALLALGALSAAWSFDPRLTLERTAAFALLLWVGVVVVPTHASAASERRELCEALAVVAVLGGLAALVAGLADPAVARQRGDTNGLRGWLENSNGMGIWCATLAPSLLAVRSRRLALAGAAVLGAVVVWSTSRSALLAVAVVGIASLPISPQRRVAVGATALAVLATLVLSPVGGSLPGTALGKYQTSSADWSRTLTGARDEGWDATFDEVVHRPVAGFGFGTGDRVFAHTGADSQFVHFQGNNPNNGYLQALLELGVLGLELLYLALAAALLTAWPLRGDPTRRPFLLMAIVLLIVAVAESIFTSAGGPYSVLLWSGLGVAMGTMPIRLPARSYARAA